jgi:leucyl aminopeptidase
MKFQLSSGNAVTAKVDLVVVDMVDEKIPKGSSLDTLNHKLKNDLAHIIKKEEFKGSAGQSKLIYTRGRLPADYILILGLGKHDKITLETLRKAGDAVQGTAKQIKAKNIAVAISASLPNKCSEVQTVSAFGEGLILGSYQFTRYTKPGKDLIESVAVYGVAHKNAEAVRAGFSRTQSICHAVCLARDLINTPACDMTPKHLADAARGLSGVKTKIHDVRAIKRMKMNSFLSVALGSTCNPPYFIEMHYKPKGKSRKKIALIGKGVTFDTGGYSIKNAKGMETMKDDMSGAAAVIAFMSIVAKLGLKVEVSGYVAATENMVSGFAQRPGDICRSLSGKTIEVLNTDAEGRLTLADAMTYAAKRKPDYMIDMATLTGACLVALGMQYSGIMGTDQELIDKVCQRGKIAGENIWQLPLAEEYKDELKSPIADLKNIGGSYGGTITAALFLENFTHGIKWAHIDIAGPAFTEKPLPYTPRGGTGVMVRTLVNLMEKI